MAHNTFNVINITAVPLSVALWRVLKLHPKPIQMRTPGMSITNLLQNKIIVRRASSVSLFKSN